MPAWRIVATVDPTQPDEPTTRPHHVFYRHLVGSLAAEVAIPVVAAATGSIAAWVWAILVFTCLALAAHASVVFAPTPPAVTPRENRRTPWE